MIEFVDSAVSLLMRQSALAAVLTLIIIPLTYVFRKSYPGLLLALWVLIPIRLILPTDFSFSYSIAELFTQSLPIATMESYSPLLGLDIELHKLAHFNRPAPPLSPYGIAIIFTLWLIGFMTFLFRYLRAHQELRRLLSRANICTDWHAQAHLFQLKKTLGCTRSIKILVSQEFTTPFTAGVITPCICLPEYSLKAPKKHDLAAIIAHELVHIKAYDNLFLFCINLLQCVFFFHPSIWLAKSKIIEQRECLTDLQVIRHGIISQTNYAKLLLNHVSHTGTTALQTMPSLSSNFKAMKNRLYSIQKSADFNKHAYRFFTAAVFALAFIFITPLQAVTGTNLYSHIADIEFQMPVKNSQLAGKFGYTQLHGRKEKAMHYGIDFNGPVGSKVYAVAKGRVLEITPPKKGKARHILIQHTPNVLTRYALVDDFTVKVGDFVSAGTVLGTMVQKSSTKYAELHFELIKDYHAIDPLEYIKIK